jgi:hypothetical protein
MQAPLQMSTAACARQGRMGRDQVREQSAVNMRLQQGA